MPGSGVMELAANRELQGDEAFEATFPPTAVGEITVECDPKKSGPPICVLTDAAGAKSEVHPMPTRGREGRYSSHVKEPNAWTAVRVTIARGKKAHLVKVRLIPRVDHSAPVTAPKAAEKPRAAEKPKP